MAEKIASATEERTPPHVEVTQVARVYLRDQELARKSAYHTGYCGYIHPATGDYVQESLTFWRGCAQNVPLATYERFRDAGICTTDRPRRRFGEDEL